MNKIILLFLFALIPLIPNAEALCAGDINYDQVLSDSELVFIGTVDRLENYDGPQRVYFIIHEVIKGEITDPISVNHYDGMLFHNSGLTFNGDLKGMSSLDVEYEISKTYKVYVINGDTSSCTTKQIYQTDYLWQPGPESGNNYAENPVWEDPCPEGYGQSDGVCITLEEMNRDSPKRGDGPTPEPEPPITENQLNEMCRTGQALCQPAIPTKPNCNVLHIPIINYALDGCQNIESFKLTLIVLIIIIPIGVIILFKYRGKF